ncbi:hypothetical protein [Novosphingobium barchaimii]|uniref:hypothetical protein n=1 Tax=Novosphingobium barchaimii TaxID=1420591 RepID=UPI000AAE4E37|nr:hypothetical protein [Novosphingobium barchaimii]
MINRRLVIVNGAVAIAAVALPFGSVGSAVAQEPNLEADLAAVRKRLASYYKKVTNASLASPPPGAAASNGWFVKYMKDDADLSVTQRPIQTATSEGKICADLAQGMMAYCRSGFGPGTYKANWATSFDMLLANLEAATSGFTQMASQMVHSILGDIPVVNSIVEQIDGQINQLAASARQKGPTSGDHANGWISVGVRDGANAWLGQSNGALGNLTAPKSKDLVETMKVFANAMAGLNTEGHSPWLKGEWQVGFGAITSTAYHVLEAEPD